MRRVTVTGMRQVIKELAKRVRPLLVPRLMGVERVLQWYLAALLLRLPLRRSTILHLLLEDSFSILVRVDPHRVQYRSAPGSKPLNRRFLQKKFRNSVKDLIRVDETWPTAVTMRQLLEQGLEPRRTLQYRVMINSITDWENSGKRGKPKNAWWCRSASDVDRYFRILLQACHQIGQDRYKLQSELHGQGLPAWKKYVGEIPLTIGADGTLYKRGGGTHRLLIAQHFQIARIPVRIVSIDREWAKTHLQSRSGALSSLIESALQLES